VIAPDLKQQQRILSSRMPNTDADAEDPSEKIAAPDLRHGRGQTRYPRGRVRFAARAVAKALEESDHDEVMRLLNWVLIHHVSDWPNHYPLHRIREHVWSEAGKTPKEMAEQPVFFDIAYKPSPLLKRVADLPIYGDKAELAQFDAPHLLAEIDITDTYVRKGHPAHCGQG
jgi:hypothetical protein